MTERLGHKLGVGRKPVLSSIGLLALAVPVAVGFANASRRPAESRTANPAHSNEYEVASIRPRSESGGMVSWGLLADGFTAKNVTLQWTPDESRAPMFKGTEGGSKVLLTTCLRPKLPALRSLRRLKRAQSIFL